MQTFVTYFLYFCNDHKHVNYLLLKAPTLLLKFFFLSTTKIRKNTTNILKCCFHKCIDTLSYQTKYLQIGRRSRLQVFFKIGVPKNFSNLTEKHMFESLFNKAAGPRVSNFIKKRLRHRCFLRNLQKL